jgi:hypothetical protein
MQRLSEVPAGGDRFFLVCAGMSSIGASARDVPLDRTYERARAGARSLDRAGCLRGCVRGDARAAVGCETLARLEIPVRLDGRDRAALLAAWLGELAFLAETRGLAPDRLSLDLDEGGLRALVQGWEGTPPHLVKGATYNRLRFERAGAGWRARVVLDV